VRRDSHATGRLASAPPDTGILERCAKGNREFQRESSFLAGMTVALLRECTNALYGNVKKFWVVAAIVSTRKGVT